MDLSDRSKYIQITVTDSRDYDMPEYHVFAVGGEYKGTFSRSMFLKLLRELGFAEDYLDLIISTCHNFNGICLDPKTLMYKGVRIEVPEPEFGHLGLM